MRLFVRLYKKMLSWSRHPKALRYLAVVSFLDSSIFPISPAFMMIPMIFAKPKSAFSIAFITTVASIVGGLIGYGLGFFVFEALMKPFIDLMGYSAFYHTALEWFQKWGFWAILLACFSPIPYKIFTIGAGVMQLNLALFLLSSSLGRLLRFFLIAALIRWGGPKMEFLLRRVLTRLD